MSNATDNPYSSPAGESSVPQVVNFQAGVIRPVECIKQSWELIKDDYWLFLGIAFVGMLIGGAVPIVLIGPMMCGIYLCYLTRLRGGAVNFEMLFKGFDYFMESLLASLIVVGITMVVVLPLICIFVTVLVAVSVAASEAGGDAGAAVIPFVMVIGELSIITIANLIGVFFVFNYPLIVDRGLKAWPAVKTSYRAVMANLMGMIGLILLVMLLSFAGACACGVGQIFVIPVTIGSFAVAYRTIFLDEGEKAPPDAAAKPNPNAAT